MTTVQVIGIDLPDQIETHREAFARAVRAAFAAGADRVELIDGVKEVGWIEADGRAHYQPVLPFTGDDWPFNA